MDFDKHLFISYAHLDNQPFMPDRRGWISLFHEILTVALDMRLGERAKIWRDDKLRGNDIFTREILDQLKGAALLASVISPRYLQSEWCTRELTEFFERASAAGNLTVGNQCRVLKVIKTPIDDAAAAKLPALLREMDGYRFYVDRGKGPVELDPVFGPDYAQDLALEVAELAWHIKQLLDGMKQAGAQGSPPREVAARPSVYLAQTDPALREQRQRLATQLDVLGYDVLPRGALPSEASACLAEIDRCLQRCQLSVHLIEASAQASGGGYAGVVELQNERAAALWRGGQLGRRMLWIHAPQAGATKPLHALVERLSPPGDGRGTDVLTRDFAELERSVVAALRSPLAAREAPLQEPAGSGVRVAPQARVATAPLPGQSRVYVLCVERDRRGCVELFRFLRDHGFEPQLPAFTGEAAAVRAVHETLVADCDSVLVVYGHGDEAWKTHQQNELRKATALRERPFMARFTCLFPPSTDDKQFMIDSGEPGVIDLREGFSAERFDPFLAALPNARRAS